MPFEVIEENQFVAQIRITCDNCGEYIGTRIVLQSELAKKSKQSHLCVNCRKNQNPSLQ